MYLHRKGMWLQCATSGAFVDRTRVLEGGRYIHEVAT
jgi:hypothetical protein